MALNYTGYYELVQKLTTDFQNDEAVNRVTFGDLLSYDRTKETITPCVHIIPNPFTINSETVTSSFQIFCYDLLSQKKLSQEELLTTPNGFTNFQDCLDTCMAALLRVLEPYNGRTIRLGSTYVDMSAAPSFDPVLEEGDSGLCGWLGTVTFEFNPNVCKSE